jgi:hypothetical protein
MTANDALPEPWLHEDAVAAIEDDEPYAGLPIF